MTEPSHMRAVVEQSMHTQAMRPQTDRYSQEPALHDGRDGQRVCQPAVGRARTAAAPAAAPVRRTASTTAGTTTTPTHTARASTSTHPCRERFSKVLMQMVATTWMARKMSVPTQ
jgi:hypothetical protein